MVTVQGSKLVLLSAKSFANTEKLTNDDKVRVYHNECVPMVQFGTPVFTFTY